MSKVKLVSKPKIANIRESLFSKSAITRNPKGFTKSGIQLQLFVNSGSITEFLQSNK